MRVLHILGAAALICAPFSAASAEAVAVPTLQIDGTDYGSGSPSGQGDGAIHWYTPTPNPTHAAFGDVVWTGNGSEHIGSCEAAGLQFESMHWVHAPAQGCGGLLTISNVVCSETGNGGNGNGNGENGNGDNGDNGDNGNGENGNGETPEPETPDPETPEVETPDVETPETPEVETPEVPEVPEVEVLVPVEVETPEAVTPVVEETPEAVEVPEVEVEAATPVVETAPTQLPHTGGPALAMALLASALLGAGIGLRRLARSD